MYWEEKTQQIKTCKNLKTILADGGGGYFNIVGEFWLH